MERENERGVAKRPDLNELDVPEWAELRPAHAATGSGSKSTQ
jgi:hypothetical protein